jgi:hypothetical protein
MKNLKNKRTSILVVILLGLLIVAYKIMFVSSDENLPLEENITAGDRVESVLREVESINFDTSVMEDPKFQSLESIEVPLISLPIGKKNPFSAI